MLYEPLIVVIIFTFFFILVVAFSAYAYHHGVNLAPYSANLERLKEEIASAQSTLSELTDKKGDLLAQQATAERIIAEGKAEKKFLDEHASEIANKRANFESLKQEIAKTNDELNQEKQKLGDIRSDIAEASGTLQKLKCDCDELSRGNRNLKKENKDLEKEKEALEEEIKNNSRHIITDEEEKWRDLNRPLPALNDWRETRSKRRKRDESETEFLANFRSRLEECNITFHDRAIYAFHTGLKVADSSPLVVLAGISGTGKSLLPRLYARAAGMTFHQIAVQPRWDNPQDMFGFYNYMEGRYKATELSRLLWQCDIWNNVPAAKDAFGDSADDLPMNLVLLDEMNLAKVEYYFSDLLSKLEVRRDVVAEDRQSRAPAEIELEGGSNQKDKDAGKRMFVAWNTLFVGTMNEDESTQSLSDKVLDRSNVLRFGRPKAIEANPDVSRFQEECKDAALSMDFGAWKEWFRSADGDFNIKTDEADAINEINDALANVGRPFAFRVFSSIRSYLANYPIQSDAGRRDALADQIEMKVLPKLNGLDKSSSSTEKALDDIYNILEQKVKDKELLDAFQKAKSNQDETSFQWRGVTR